MYIYNEEKIARKKILQKFFEFQAKATRSWAEVPFELMIIICKTSDRSGAKSWEIIRF